MQFASLFLLMRVGALIDLFFTTMILFQMRMIVIRRKMALYDKEQLVRTIIFITIISVCRWRRF